MSNNKKHKNICKKCHKVFRSKEKFKDFCPVCKQEQNGNTKQN